MTPTKQARVLRDWFKMEKLAAGANHVVAKDTFINVQQEHMRDKKRPQMFTLVIEHEDGFISVPLNSEVLGQWKRAISEISLAFWNAGQHLPYGKHRGADK
jgi:hypothetical protein